MICSRHYYRECYERLRVAHTGSVAENNCLFWSMDSVPQSHIRLCKSSLYSRKFDHKPCFTRLNRLQRKFTAMIKEYFFHQRKANTLAIFFCAEEGAEQLIAGICCNAA